MFNRILKVAPPILLAYFLLFIPYSHAENEEEVFYYLTDHLGGVDVVTDEAGNVVERKDYLPFGDDRFQPQLDPQLDLQSDPQPESYGYTGKEQDDETGLYYYGARYYDPETGRFTQIDPLVLGESEKPLSESLSNPQALNGYSYVLNNPMILIDKEGFYSVDVHYDLTFYLAMVSGLDFGQSKTVAFFDQYVDDNPETMPVNTEDVQQAIPSINNNANGITIYYHFAFRSNTIKRLDRALSSGDLSAFGTALHTYQDTYSHAGLTPLLHAAFGHMPDETYLSPNKALIMARNSFYYLRNMNAKINGMGDMKLEDYNAQSNQLWNTISVDVKKFLEMKNKAGHDITKSATVIKQDAVITKPDDDKKESIKQN